MAPTVPSTVVTPAPGSASESRPTPGARGRSVQLEAIRGLAALMVVAVHVGFLSGSETAFANSDSGLHLLLRHGLTDSVVIFFALSGYLIGGPFLRSLLQGDGGVGLAAYAIRRTARIVPAYWAALAVMFLFLAPATGYAWWQVPVHALLIQNSVPGEAIAVLAVAWTLGIEAAFYLAMPLLTMAIRRCHRGPVGGGTLAGIIVALWVASAVLGGLVDSSLTTSLWWSSLNLNIPFCLCLFCPGMLIAVIEARPPRLPGPVGGAGRRLARHPVALALPTVLAFVISAWLAEAPTLWVSRLHYQFAAVGAGLLVVIALRARQSHRIGVRLLGAAGTVSYGLYLWHWVVLSALLRLGIRPMLGLSWTAWLADGVLLFSLSIPAAVASWYLIEKPAQGLARSWVRRIGSRTRRRAAAKPVLRPGAADRRLGVRLLAAAWIGALAGVASAFAVSQTAETSALAAPPAVSPQLVGRAVDTTPTTTLLPDPRPIVAFGDSLTESYGVPLAQSYPVQLAAVLGEPVVSAPFEGKTTGEALALLPKALADDPRLMVIEFGTNDSCTGVPMATAVAHLEAILDILDARGIPAVLVGTHYDAVEHNISPLCDHNIPYSGNWDAALAALAARHHAGLVTDVLHGLARQADHYHPLAAGYRTMAERVAPAVRAVELESDAVVRPPV